MGLSNRVDTLSYKLYNVGISKNIMENNNNLKLTIQNLLNKYKIKLDPDTKDQHLLVNSASVIKLIESADISGEDIVLEIGGGTGTISEKIAQQAKKLICLEVDPKFVQVLKEKFQSFNNVTVIDANFLTYDLPKIDKVIANPPFSILEPMIQKIACSSATVSCLIIGEKYYQRTMAEPGSINYTKTSLFTQAFFNIELIDSLSQDDFYPPLRERVVIIRLTRHHQPDQVYQLIANIFMNSAGEKVQYLMNSVSQLLYSLDSKNAKELDVFNKLVKSTPQEMMNRRIQKLNNSELSTLVAKIKKSSW